MFKDQLCAALGGHAAEELVFGEASTGPSNDLEQVTGIARSMVTRWGMSERLGPRTFGRNDDLVFLGREISETRNYSEKVAEEIDDEVRRIIEEAQQPAPALILREKSRRARQAGGGAAGRRDARGRGADAPARRAIRTSPWPPPGLRRKEEAAG